MHNDFLLARFASEPALPFDFDLAVPRGFALHPETTGITVPPPKRAFNRIATFLGSGEAPPEIFVEAAMIPRELNPGELAQHEAQKDGVQILQRVDSKNVWVQGARMLGWEMRDAARWLLIMRIVKDGVRIFRITAREREDRFPSTSQKLTEALDSFRLTAPEKAKTCEVLESIRVQSPIAYAFSYPGSWERLVDPAGMQNDMLQLLHRVGENEAGRLLVAVYPHISAVTHSGALRRFSLHVQEIGVHVCGSPIVKVAHPASFDTAHQYSPIAIKDGEKCTVLAWAMEHSSAIVLIGLIGPSRSYAPVTDSVNRRTHQILRETFQVH